MDLNKILRQLQELQLEEQQHRVRKAKAEADMAELILESTRREAARLRASTPLS